MVRTDEWFDAMFTRHAPDVLRYAQRRLTDQQGVQDVVSETFLAAWRLRHQRPASVAEELPWLYALALGVVRNQQRSSRRQVHLWERLADNDRPSDRVEQDHSTTYAALELLKAGLAQLTPDDEELLRLVAWEGLGPAEVAVVLGLSTSAAGVRIHRARRRLRASLSASQAEDASTLPPTPARARALRIPQLVPPEV